MTVNNATPSKRSIIPMRGKLCYFKFVREQEFSDNKVLIKTFFKTLF